VGNDVFDLAAVDAEFPGYRALAVTSLVPGPYRLLHARCAGQRRWSILLGDRQRVAHLGRKGWCGAGWDAGPDECHQEFERVGQPGSQARMRVSNAPRATPAWSKASRR